MIARKKPITVEVFHYTCREDMYDMDSDLRRFLAQGNGADWCISDDELLIHTLEGDMYASIGDYIIRGVNGEYYPIKPEIFERTYDIVEG